MVANQNINTEASFWIPPYWSILVEKWLAIDRYAV